MNQVTFAEVAHFYLGHVNVQYFKIHGRLIGMTLPAGGSELNIDIMRSGRCEDFIDAWKPLYPDDDMETVKPYLHKPENKQAEIAEIIKNLPEDKDIFRYATYIKECCKLAIDCFKLIENERAIEIV